MTTKKKPVKKDSTTLAESSVSQFQLNEAVIVGVGPGRGGIGRVMSLDPPHGCVKVRLGGATHYQYTSNNIRPLHLADDLPIGTIVTFKQNNTRYTIKRAFRMNDHIFAMVVEVPYPISLEGWHISGHGEKQLTDGERTRYENLREISENFVAQCKTQGLVELVPSHTLPLDIQLRTATESLMRAYGGLMCRLASIRNIAG